MSQQTKTTIDLSPGLVYEHRATRQRCRVLATYWGDLGPMVQVEWTNGNLRRKAVRVYGVPAAVLAAGLRGYVEVGNG